MSQQVQIVLDSDVIDKIETFMGQTLVTVTYTQPDALSGFGGCFVDVHITKQ